MGYVKNLIVVLITSVIIGCTTTNTVFEEDIVEKVHPTMPKGISTYVPVLKLGVVDEELLVSMSFDDFQYFRIFLGDTLRYIKETNDMLCFYREKLNEDFCIKDNNE